ncbi:MAG: hypothetical protein ACKV19_00450, partial [Verrucomicrobiales bacterium]
VSGRAARPARRTGRPATSIERLAQRAVRHLPTVFRCLAQDVRGSRRGRQLRRAGHAALPENHRFAQPTLRTTHQLGASTSNMDKLLLWPVGPSWHGAGHCPFGGESRNLFCRGFTIFDFIEAGTAYAMIFA